MKVKVYEYIKDAFMGNIVWARQGDMDLLQEVPLVHPVGDGSDRDGSPLAEFRKRGYFASCFPEGDGICWEPLREQSPEQALQDIMECFGWDAVWGRKPGSYAVEREAARVRQEEALARAEADRPRIEAEKAAAQLKAREPGVLSFAGDPKWTPVIKGLIGNYVLIQVEGDSGHTFMASHPDEDSGGPVTWENVADSLISEVGVERATGEGCGYLNQEETLLRVARKLGLNSMSEANSALAHIVEYADDVAGLEGVVRLALMVRDGHNLTGVRSA